MKALILLALLLISCATAFPQIDTTRKEFFPLHVGDLWQYTDQDHFLLSGKVEGDTLIDGQTYFIFRRPLRTSVFGITRIDSLIRIQNRLMLPVGGNTCGGSMPYEMSIYHLNEPAVSVWPICSTFWALPTPNPLVRFDGTFLMNVFGQAREVMRFDFGGTVQRAPFDTIFGFGALLARGIGVLHEQYYDGDYSILQGCIIGGVQYGTIVSVEDVPETVPIKLSVAQNYPNPFNPVTVIGYELGQSGFVSLKVYNVLSQEVATLADGFQFQGRYKAAFDAGELASGVYLYKLIANGRTLVRKMILAK